MTLFIGPRHCSGAHDSDGCPGGTRPHEGVFSGGGESVDSWTPGRKRRCHRHRTGPHPRGLSWTPWTPGRPDGRSSTHRALAFAEAFDGPRLRGAAVCVWRAMFGCNEQGARMLGRLMAATAGLAALAIANTAAAGPVLDAAKARGAVACGVGTGTAGYML